MGEKMRIVVNNIAASSSGALSILKSFYNYLVKTEAAKENEWIFLLSDRYLQETENIKVIVVDDVKKSWISRLNFDLYSGKDFISKIQPDVVFSLQNTITRGLKCPQVLYMHQSIPFQNVKKFSFFKSEEREFAIYQYLIGMLIKSSIKKADKIVVQTKWIRDAVIEATHIPSQKIMDVLPPMENFATYKKDHLLQRNSFFYPSAKSIYKNHQCIYHACSLLKEKGMTDYNVSLTIENDGEGINENITYLGTIPFKAVLEKYNSSTLIFPSYIETVGLPLIEARQIGTIILAADCPFSREVLHGYENAYFFDPFNPQQLAQLMEKVMDGQIMKVNTNHSEERQNNSWGKVTQLFENIHETTG